MSQWQCTSMQLGLEASHPISTQHKLWTGYGCQRFDCALHFRLCCLIELQIERVTCSKSGITLEGTLHLTAHHLIFNYDKGIEPEMWVSYHIKFYSGVSLRNLPRCHTP
jgi:hypothetical protein